MKQLGQKLSSGLNNWVDEGECPPEVAQRIELAIRGERRRSWWQTWPALTGAAAAAVFLVLVAGAQTNVGQSLTKVPLVGTMIAPFARNNSEPEKVINATAEHDGVTLTVATLYTTRDGTTVRYTLRGKDLNTGLDYTRYQPELRGKSGQAKLKNITSRREADTVVVEALFEPVAFGQTLTFSLQSLPDHQGPWTVDIKN